MAHIFIEIYSKLFFFKQFLKNSDSSVKEPDMPLINVLKALLKIPANLLEHFI